MALGTIPPWLDITPETFLGAAKAGAQIGTQRRAQDLDAQDAADRLRLAYDSLASQERRASESEQMKLELAKNAQELRQSQLDAVNLRAQERLQQQQQQGEELGTYRENLLNLRTSRGEALDKYRGEMIGEREKSLAQREDTATKMDAYRQQLSDARQQTMQMKQQQAADALTPLQKHDLTVKARGLSEAQRALSAAIASTDPDAISSARKMLEGAKKDYTDFRSGLEKTKNQAPHADGTILRHKDGTRWIVKDGIPVPIDQAQAAPDSTNEEPPPEE